MITGIAIENFKGIGERVEIELKPITLLFGPNSAGKSTILHSIHYAREVLEHHNLDADSTSTGAQFIDLGGFRNIVHGHDLSRPIHLRFTFQLDEADFASPEFDSDAWETILGGKPQEVLKVPVSAAIELTICWSENQCTPFVARCLIQLDSTDFAEITATDSASPTVSFQLIGPESDPRQQPENDVGDGDGMAAESSAAYAQPEQATLRSAMAAVVERWTHSSFARCYGRDSSGPQTRLLGLTDALPRAGTEIRPQRFHGTTPGFAGGGLVRSAVSEEECFAQIRSLVMTPLRALRKRLQQFRYLGPLREIPSRHATPPRSHDPNRWATGLGAWDMLQTGSDDLVQSVSQWLHEKDRLNAGVRLERRTWAALDESGQPTDEFPKEDRLYIVPDDSDVKLSPHDVGVGISQIVPVIVAGLDKTAGLDAIEEPEYHLHPRLQAELGDLLLEGTQTQGKQFLIETHSENLVLRLQRRIRETTRENKPTRFRVTTNDVVVYFVYRDEGQTRRRRIDLDKEGEFVQPWPDDLFEVDFYERFG